MPHRLWRHRRLEEKSEQRGNEQRHADAGDAGLPAEPVEELAEHRGAHEPAEEIEGKIETARRAPVELAARPTKPVAVACAKKVPTPTSTMPVKNAARLEDNINGRPRAATASEPQKVARVPKRSTARPARGVVAIDGRNTK